MKNKQPWSEEKVQKRLLALRGKIKRDARTKHKTVTVLSPFDDKSLEQLVADHLRLRNALGAKHPMVSNLWSEIRKRRDSRIDIASGVNA